MVARAWPSRRVSCVAVDVEPTAPPADLGRRRLAWSTAIFSLATGLSRILGLVREIVAAYYFGASGRINSFTVAFQIPNLVRALVADAALSSAFVPVFSELLEKGERKRAWRVASSLFWLMLLGLGALTALFMLIAPLLLRPFHPVDPSLTVGLARVLFPIVALLGVSGIVVGILNSYDEFSIPALAPVAWNVAIIAGLAIGVPSAHSSNAKLYVYAASILAATVIQVLLPIPWLRGKDDRLRVVIDWRDPAVRQTLKLMLPVTLGLGLINVNAVVDVFFASRLIDPAIAPTAIDKAFGSTCCRRECFRWRSRPCSSRRSRARLPAQTSTVFAPRLRSACARLPSCSSRQASSRPCLPRRSFASSINTVPSRRTTRPPSQVRLQPSAWA